MARPKPTVILEHVDKEYKSEQVLAADAIYAVFYGNQPINLKSFGMISDKPDTKYKKTSFSNSGHAFNLADRLNKLFNTEEFHVVKLTEGTPIDEIHGPTKGYIYGKHRTTGI